MTQTAKAGLCSNAEIYDNLGKKIYSIPIKSVIDDKKVIRGLSIEESAINKLIFEDLIFELGYYDSAIFHTCNFINVEAFGSWICDAIFEQCKFIGFTLYSAEAFAVKFTNTTFKNATFEGVNFTEAVFENCKFESCTFTSNNINTFTDLSDSKFLDCVLVDSKFIDVEVNENTQLPNNAKIEIL